MKRKCKILFICIIAALLSLSMKDPKQKTLHFAVPVNYDVNYDPVEGNYINLQFFFRSVYATLFKLDENLRPYPFLLETYKRKGKTVLFHLKKEAKFSDGSDITSADVVRSIEAGMIHSSYPNPVYKVIQGGEDLFKGKTRHCTGIKILAPKRFEILLKNENVEFDHYFAAVIMSILPVDRNRTKNKKLFSGPFQVVKEERKKNRLILTLKKNPRYIGEKPVIETLFVHAYLDHSDLEKAILKGEPDLFLYNRRFRMPPSRYPYNYFKTPSFGAFYFKLNPKSGPFKDKRLRTFFKYFIRSRNVSKGQKWVLTTPYDLVLPYSLTGYSVFKQIAPRDFKPYIPGKKVTIKCVNSRAGIRRPLFPLLKKKLKKYNIHLELHWDSLSNIYKQERAGTVDLTAVYYMADVPLSSYFYETLFTPGHELNLFEYEVPEALKLLNDYRRETDQIKKLKLLSRLEEIAQEEAFLIPLVNPLSLLGYKKHLKNVSIDKFLNVNFEEIDVKDK